jgi:phenylacetic acid degradation operon negative regulatory protein
MRRNYGDCVSTLTAAQAGPADTQPRELIVTLYGLYARAEHNWLSVASLVRLMADLGVDGPAVRSSVSRLKRRDTLRSLRLDGAAGYALSPSSLQALREGDGRIFGRRRATLEDGWVLVVFSVPERERDKRHELRTWLTKLGFGTAAPGVWVAPGILADETWEVLARRGLDTYADMFRDARLAFADLRAKVVEWWDLDELSARYAQFIGRSRPLAKRWAGRPVPARDAFVDYVPMLTSWRRLPYLDPGLPLDLLPRQWNGVTAGDLFTELNLLLAEPARQHALSVIHR